DGYSFILQKSTDSRLDEKERHYIEVIRKNIGIMDNLINGLLTLSRVGRQELSREWIDPTALVREIVAMRLEPMPDRQIEIRVGELPHCYADPVMLRQVYENLIGNAVKFTRDTNAPRIEIGAIVRDSTILYYVRDNGIGFDMKYAEQIFKPFQRLHKPEEFEGSGIGLASVERIIHRHGGKIWAESEPGKGATFYFTFEEST
nr:ATP-binding protein [Methanoregulaceae archaeon]